jgi:hypothetical protein
VDENLETSMDSGISLAVLSLCEWHCFCARVSLLVKEQLFGPASE